MKNMNYFCVSKFSYFQIFDERGERITKREFVAAKIEATFRILLPCFFVLFNFIYWLAAFA